jgi:hypothetical protein
MLMLLFIVILIIPFIIFVVFNIQKDRKKMKICAFAYMISCSLILVYSIVCLIVYRDDIITKDNNSTTSSNYTTEQTFYYKQTATAINERMFQTEDGNIWIMNNVQLEKNEKYEITFDNHDTEIITDDEIVDFIKLNEKG